MAYIEVVAGLVLLVVAGDLLVKGAVSIAQNAGISKLIIGLTIVAFGTSAPELFVGVDAVLDGAAPLALGNVVGSNIANVLLVIGLPAMIAPMTCDAPRIGRNLFIMLMATALFMLLAFGGKIAFFQGIILLLALTSFLVYSGLRAKHGCENDAIDGIEELHETPESYTKATFLVIAGLLGLAFGANLLVGGSVEIARHFGVSEAVIGLTLVALGTSLPELVTALVAAIRGHCEVAVGNVIGSNIFNILGIMGVTSMFGEIPVSTSFMEVDLWVMLASSMLLIPFCMMKARVGKVSGFAMVVLYIAYMVYLANSPDSASAMGMHFE